VASDGFGKHFGSLRDHRENRIFGHHQRERIEAFIALPSVTCGEVAYQAVVERAGKGNFALHGRRQYLDNGQPKNYI
jgi:hypothetical protein